MEKMYRRWTDIPIPVRRRLRTPAARAVGRGTVRRRIRGTLRAAGRPGRGSGRRAGGDEPPPAARCRAAPPRTRRPGTPGPGPAVAVIRQPVPGPPSPVPVSAPPPPRFRGRSVGRARPRPRTPLPRSARRGGGVLPVAVRHDRHEDARCGRAAARPSRRADREAAVVTVPGTSPRTGVAHSSPTGSRSPVRRSAPGRIRRWPGDPRGRLAAYPGGPAERVGAVTRGLPPDARTDRPRRPAADANAASSHRPFPPCPPPHRSGAPPR